MIEVSNISKKYGPTVAVEQVSFSVSKGEVLGFLGPNGAGKTTTMRMLTGFIQADAGSAAGITIPGMALAGIDGSGCSFGMTTGDLSFDMDFAAVPANPVSAVFAVTITGM